MVKGRHEVSEGFKPEYAWLAKVGVAVALVIAVFMFIWFQLRPPQSQVPPPQRAEQPSMREKEPAVTPPVTPPESPPAPKEAPLLIARATWSTDPEASLRAIRIEPTRSGAMAVDLSHSQATLFIRVPIDDETGEMYFRYRITLLAQDKPFWLLTLRAPEPAVTARAHILRVILFSQQLPESNSYDLQVEGRTESGWKPLGHVSLNPMSR
jgi:hypothetical protein